MLVFSTPGLIDIRAIKTFGVSAKNHGNPIGRFGTGLKYAIAIFLREGHEVEMFSDNKHYKFELKDIEMRGKEFKIITMNDEELPFTTHLGSHWALWQAFRELYCNTIDERGETDFVDYVNTEDTSDKTIFIVKGRMAQELYLDRHNTVLNLKDDTVIGTSGHVDVYDRPSRYAYYRGIRVMEFAKPALFTYNIIGEADITEDRTLTHPSTEVYKFPMAIAQMNSPVNIRKALVACRDFAESTFSYHGLDNYDQKSPTACFLETLASEFNRNNDQLNVSARHYHQKLINSSAPKNFEVLTLNEVQTAQLERAKKVLSKMYPDFNDYAIMIVKTLGQQTMGMADPQTNTMIISARCFEMGTKYLTATLMEEFFHLKTGYEDLTRALQTYLFDQVTTMIETYAIKEPI